MGIQVKDKNSCCLSVGWGSMAVQTAWPPATTVNLILIAALAAYQGQVHGNNKHEQ